MRRAATLLGVSKNIVSLRFAFLGLQAEAEHEQWLARCSQTVQVQVDDLISLEHTKCKPLCVCVVINAKQRLILGAGMARIHASSPLAWCAASLECGCWCTIGRIVEDALKNMSPIWVIVTAQSGS